MWLCGLKKVQDARLCLLRGRNGDFNGIKAFKYHFISVLTTLKVHTQCGDCLCGTRLSDRFLPDHFSSGAYMS